MSRLVIGRTWDGALLPEAGRTVVRFGWGDGVLNVGVDAPYAGDPPPPGPPGPTEGLWAFEVVELFVRGEGERYTEIELGPHGHHLVLRLDGVRQRVDGLHPIGFAPTIVGGRWRGTATVPRTLLPDRLVSCNAFRVAGTGEARRYEAMVAAPGERPDFHRLDRFAPWPI